MKFMALAIVGSLLFAGCSSTRARLAIPDDGAASVCGPAGNNGEIFVGVDFLRNDGNDSAAVAKVELVDFKNLELRGFGLLGNTETGDRGVMQSADGNLAPGSGIAAGDTAALQVKLALTNPGEPGSAQSLKVTYGDPDGSANKSIKTVTSLDVLPTGQACQ